MPDITENLLIKLSDALTERASLARALVVGIAAPGHRLRSGTLWRKDVVVASEQRFPDVGDATVTCARWGCENVPEPRPTRTLALRVPGQTPLPGSQNR